jgi:hypothetical protein
LGYNVIRYELFTSDMLGECWEPWLDHGAR